MHAANNLKNKMFELERKKNGDSTDVYYIFGMLREILEANNMLKEKSPTLKLFCNWSVHTHLESSITQLRALERISIALFEAVAKGPSVERDIAVQRQMASAMQFGKLRREIGDIFSHYRISTALVDGESSWKAFLYKAAYNLRDKPVKFSDLALSGVENRQTEKQIKILKRIAQHKHASNFGTIISVNLSLLEDNHVFGAEKRGILITYTNKSGAKFAIGANLSS